MESPSQDFQSKHFKIVALAEGVYAAIHKQGGWAIGNAGIVDLGDTTLVFDTFISPAAALELRQAAEYLTGRQPELVINSHYHNDHIWGNQVFLPEAKIVSSTGTYELILSAGQEEYEWYYENSRPELARLEADLAREPEPARREQIERWIPYYRALVNTMPILEVCYPQITFRERMTIHGSARHAEIRAYRGGHTGNDAILLLPVDRIGFLSDLLFVNHHLFLADGDPAALLGILEEISDLELEALVPGHGPAGSPADLETNIDYIQTLLELIDQIPADQLEEPALAGIPVPEGFENWGFSNFFRLNLKFLSQRRRL